MDRHHRNERDCERGVHIGIRAAEEWNQQSCLPALFHAVMLFILGGGDVLADGAETEEAERAIAFEYLHVDVVQINNLAGLFGLLFGVVDYLFRRLNPADGSESGQNAYPVGDHDEEEDGHYEGEEAAGALTARDALAEVEEEFDEYFDEILQAARNLAHAPGGEEGDYNQGDDGDPCGYHRVLQREAENLGGNERLGWDLDVRQGCAKEAESEGIAESAAQ